MKTLVLKRVNSEKYKKITVSQILIDVFFLIVIFSPVFSFFFGFFNYIDEIIAAVAFAIFIKKLLEKKNDPIVFVFMFIILLFGLFGNILFSYQSSALSIGLDFFNTVRFFIVLLTSSCIFTSDEIEKGLKFCIKVLKIFLLFLLICLILAELKFLPSFLGESRYSFSSFNFVFENSGFLNYFLYSASLILLVDLFKTKRTSFIWYLIISILFISTLKTRGFIFGLLYFAICFVFRYMNFEFKKYKYFLIFIGVVFLVVISYQTFAGYFLKNTNTPRSLLVRNGFISFFEHLPLGTGFATYGTAQSSKSYSLLYYNLGMDTIWGFIPGDTEAYLVSDNFWPSIICQLGLLGTISFLAFVIYSLHVFWKTSCKCYLMKISFFYVITILLVSSTATASFYTNYAVFLGFFLSLMSKIFGGQVHEKKCW